MRIISINVGNNRGVKKKRTIESNVTEEELRHAIKRNDDSDDDPLDKVNEEKGLGYGRYARHSGVKETS